MRKAVRVFLLAGLAVLTVYIGVLQDRIMKVKREIESLASVGEHIETQRVAVGELETKVERQRSSELEQASISVNERDGSFSAENDTGIGAGMLAGDVEAWMDRANRLSHFLHLYPQYSIAEMDTLTPLEWLTVTLDAELKSEADYRAVLSELRALKKRGSDHIISEAWKAFAPENDGGSLSDISELIQYSDGRLKREMLDRFRLMTDADDYGGMRFTTDGDQTTFIEDPVDPLWDTRRYARIGGTAQTLSGPWRARKQIESAIAKFTSESGRVPTASAEIAPFIEDDETRAVLPEVYRAMTTYPEL